MWRATVALATLVATGYAKDEEKEIDGPVIGIDLGTTYSCAPGFCKAGYWKIVEIRVSFCVYLVAIWDGDSK